MGTVKINRLTLYGLLLFLFPTLSWATGFEKPVMLSGKWAGLAGSATAVVTGAEPNYFNPAGLVGGAQQEVSLSLSPTFTTYTGVTFTNSKSDVSTISTLPVFSFGLKRSISDQIFYGLGVSSVANYEARYTGLSLPAPYTHEPNLLMDLKNYELSLSLAYKYNEDLNFGISWRASYINLGLSLGEERTGPTRFVESEIYDLSKVDFGGLKLGLQYKINPQWQLGASYRTSVLFAVKGKYIETTENDSTPGIITKQAGLAEVRGSMPEVLSLDAFYMASKLWNIYFGLSVKDYSSSQKMEIYLEPTTELNALTQLWDDEVNIRGAAEYLGYSDIVLRAGYVFSSQVTPSDYSLAIFSPPANTHAITLGAGKIFLKKYKMDASVEYMTSGHSQGVNSRVSPALSGPFSRNSFSLHATVTVPL